jgi:hypothetical protein
MDGLGYPSYTERLVTRLRVWWGVPRNLRDPRTYPSIIHRLREVHSKRDRDEPDEKWRCCRYWQRSLSNKWNSREFAARHGCRLPDLYWCGRDPRRLAFESLPESYVIRATSGSARRGVIVCYQGTDLLTEEPFVPAEWARGVRGLGKSLRRGRLLVEELVGGPDGEGSLPLECKVHLFGEHVGAFEVVERSAKPGQTTNGFYSAEWARFSDPMDTYLPSGRDIPVPHCLPDVLAAGTRLGAACGTYVRADFFITATGAVFNELGGTPGLGEAFTPFADEYFGRLWQEYHPNQV